MEKGVTEFERFIERLSFWINRVSCWGLFILMVMGTGAVGLRWAGVGLSGTINLSTYLLVAIVYLSLAYTQLQGQHVAVEILVSRLRGRSRLAVAVVALLLAFIGCTLTGWATWKYAWISWEARERMDGAPFYPIYPSKIAVAVGVSILWLQLIADLLRELHRSRRANVSTPDSC